MQIESKTERRRSHTDIKESYDSDGSEDSNLDVWLENIASLLGAGHRSKQCRKTSFVPSLSSESNSASSISSFSTSAAKFPPQQSSSQIEQCDIINSDSKQNDETSLSSSIQSMTKLVDIPHGSRHGLKVLKINCKKPTVGEVILEHARGWIEVNMNGKLKKCRPGNFVVAPTHYNVGDFVNIASSSQNKNITNFPSKSRNINTHQDPSKKRKMVKNNLLDIICSTSTDAQSSRKPLHEIPTEHLFYWCCDVCTMVNTYFKNKCSACMRQRSLSCKQSALLHIADTAVVAASTLQEAIDMVPEFHLPAIPNSIISNLFRFHGNNVGIQNETVDPSHHNIDCVFYWTCSHCTMKNSFKRTTCNVCKKKKNATSMLSALLEIATEISLNARSVEEAKFLLPLEHKLSIPDEVLSSLVTCIAVIGNKNNKRRCLRPRAPGIEYCTFHCDPELLETNALLKFSRKETQQIYPKANSSQHHQKSKKLMFVDLISIQSSVNDFFKTHVDSNHLNELNWNIQSIEDSILSQSHVPFPLGLLIRRFFLGYGFHDGQIIQVKRKSIIDENKNVRPFLIYLVKYNDGDTEELLHHEINSLRQFYDQCNIKAIAPCSDQIAEGTTYEAQLQARVKVPKNMPKSCIDNSNKSSMVNIDFCKNGRHWSRIEIELTKLQLIIMRKISDMESSHENPKEEQMHSSPKQNMNCPQSSPGVLNQLPPVLEWASYKQITLDNIVKRKNDPSSDREGFEMSPGLWINTKSPIKNDHHGHYSSSQVGQMSSSHVEDQSSLRPGLSLDQFGWDPAGGLNFLDWDPYRVVLCEVCDIDKDDHLILICDLCQRGYHMYCVRPVIVNVPTNEWLCAQCSPLLQKGKCYNDIIEEIKSSPKTITDFLKLPFDEPKEFCQLHKEVLSLFLPTTHTSKRIAVLGLSKSKPTAKVGHLYLPHKPTKNDWLPPVPLSNESMYTLSLATIVAAMKFCGMQSYSEELVYRSEVGISEGMNDAKLDQVESLSQRNIDTFKEFKENLKHGAFPPMRVVYDDRLGFSVEALAVIAKHTLIAEYIGEITTVERSGETSSDSLMVLLNTGSPKTSLLIDPTRTGNIARFLSGINNGNQSSRRKANVRTRRFCLDGRCRVALFTAKRIEPGDKLHYDYNAGVEGKSPVEWAKSGFYDTTHFL